MDNARYAPPLSEWRTDIEVMVIWHQSSTLNDLATGHYRTLKQCTVTREQRAEYEAKLRADAEFLRTTTLMMEGSTEFLTPQHHRHFDRLRRIADRLEGL